MTFLDAIMSASKDILSDACDSKRATNTITEARKKMKLKIKCKFSTLKECKFSFLVTSCSCNILEPISSIKDLSTIRTVSPILECNASGLSFPNAIDLYHVLFCHCDLSIPPWEAVVIHDANFFMKN